MKKEKLTKEQRQAEKNYKHSFNVVKVYEDVAELHKLRKDNPTYNDTIIELMRPYIGNARFWDFVLHTAADERKLHKSIQKLLTEANT